MLKIKWSSWQFILTCVGIAWPVTSDSIALEVREKVELGTANNSANLDSIASQPMAQINSVSKLSDVQPTDWAYQSWQSLAERYSCLFIKQRLLSYSDAV